MKKEYLSIHDSPAIIWGEPSDSVYLFIHGQGGNKEEAEVLSDMVCCRNWQVLSIDLPEHGDRGKETDTLRPWCVIPELKKVMEFIHTKWDVVSLFANSLGAWFSLMSYWDVPLQKALLLSPVLDMQVLIHKMMGWAQIDEAVLQRRQVVQTEFGQTLSWRYLEFVKETPLIHWNAVTHILVGEGDDLVDFDTVTAFANKYGCTLTVMKHGEHWFHTPEQIQFLKTWIQQNT